MKNLIFIPVLTISLIINAQKNLTIEGQKFTDSNEQWNGVYIPRSEPTDFTFKNNIITSVIQNGYMLQAGDEQPVITNNNLAGAIITGNKLIWNKGLSLKSTWGSTDPGTISQNGIWQVGARIYGPGEKIHSDSSVI
jgi:hypothetical protein